MKWSKEKTFRMALVIVNAIGIVLIIGISIVDKTPYIGHGLLGLLAINAVVVGMSYIFRNNP